MTDTLVLPQTARLNGARALPQLPSDLDAPSKMVMRNQWVLWKSEGRNGKATKVPYQPNGRPARSNDSSTWSSYAAASAALARGGYDGLGFMFGMSTAGVDLDHHVENGVLDDFAQAIVDELDSYTEYSPSGTGVHILFLGTKPEGNCKDQALGFEMYGNARFFTFTGKHVPGTADDLQERTAEAAALHQRIFHPAPQTPPSAPVAVSLTDQLILEHLRKAKNAAKFEALYGGNISGYASQSEADLALCSMIAFYTQDAAQIDSLFRSSELFRDKWDESHGQSTYGQITIQEALSKLTATYNPNYNATATQTLGSALTGKGHERILSSEYVDILKGIGYDFRMLELDQSVEVNDEMLNDGLEAEIRCKMRDLGHDSVNVIRDAYVAHAYRHQYHPIKEYLEAQAWDGKDHIAKLGGYFQDKDKIFSTWLRKFLIGAVARVYQETQNRALVLDGPQDLGKSTFVHWLAGPLASKYYVDSSISPDNKDHLIRLMRVWIWEVGEMAATTSKADADALKQFLTLENVEARFPYAKNPIRRPALTSFVATANNNSGFLNDPTGSRRFAVCELTHIDWRYKTEVDINQVWAQAKALYDRGESWRWDGDDKARANEINGRFEVVTPVFEWLDEMIAFNADAKTTTTEIVAELRYKDARETDQKLMNGIAAWMKMHDIESAREDGKREDGSRNRTRYWKGVGLLPRR